MVPITIVPERLTDFNALVLTPMGREILLSPFYKKETEAQKDSVMC